MSYFFNTTSYFSIISISKEKVKNYRSNKNSVAIKPVTDSDHFFVRLTNQM